MFSHIGRRPCTPNLRRRKERRFYSRRLDKTNVGPPARDSIRPDSLKTHHASQAGPEIVKNLMFSTLLKMAWPSLGHGTQPAMPLIKYDTLMQVGLFCEIQRPRNVDHSDDWAAHCFLWEPILTFMGGGKTLTMDFATTPGH